MCCTSKLLPLPAQEEEGTWLSVPVSGVRPECGCCWRQRLVCGCLCDRPCQCPLCVCVSMCVSVCMCLCVSGICAQLRCWLNLQRGKWQLCPSAWAETPGPQALGWAPAAEQQGLGQGRLEEVAGPNLP